MDNPSNPRPAAAATATAPAAIQRSRRLAGSRSRGLSTLRSTALAALIVSLTGGCVRAESSQAGVLCPTTEATLRQTICDDPDLRAMDREMLRLIGEFRRLPAVSQALDQAGADSIDAGAVAPAWPRTSDRSGARPTASDPGDLAQSLTNLQTSWRSTNGIASCFAPDLKPLRRRCLLAQYLETIHRLRVLIVSDLRGARDGPSSGPLELSCPGIAYPLAITRVDAASRWLFLEWDGDPREPYISAPVLLQERPGDRRGDGWSSLYSNPFPGGSDFDQATIESLELQGRRSAILSEAPGQEEAGRSRRRTCQLAPHQPGVSHPS